MATNEKLAILAEIQALLASKDFQVFAELQRRANQAAGVCFLMPQAE